MEEKEIKKYLRKVRRGLVCDKVTKDDYIEGLESEISDYMYQRNNTSYNDIVTKFGTPKRVIAELQEGVSEEECYRVRRKRTVRTVVYIVLSAIIILILVLLVLHILSLQAVELTSEIVDIEYF